jgi:hypothetical protein
VYHVIFSLVKRNNLGFTHLNTESRAIVSKEMAWIFFMVIKDAIYNTYLIYVNVILQNHICQTCFFPNI